MAITLDSDARTDLTTVRAIFDTRLDDDALTFWINAAYPAIDDVEAAGSGLTDAQLARLEAIWAAHLASTQDPRAQSQSGASRSIDYGDRQSYRAMAEQLDDTGTLESTGRPTVDFQVLPNDDEYSESGTYDPYY